jgi:hypothetical protein
MLSFSNDFWSNAIHILPYKPISIILQEIITTINPSNTLFLCIVSRSPKPTRFECLLQNSTSCYYLDGCTVSNLGLRDVMFKNIKSLVDAIMFNAANP